MKTPSKFILLTFFSALVEFVWSVYLIVNSELHAFSVLPFLILITCWLIPSIFLFVFKAMLLVTIITS